MFGHNTYEVRKHVKLALIILVLCQTDGGEITQNHIKHHKLQDQNPMATAGGRAGNIIGPNAIYDIFERPDDRT